MYKIPSGTLFLGKNMLILPECPSTNTFALELIESGQASDGMVVLTNEQTAGRGQRGNTWESGKGLNLTFSIVLRPHFLSPSSQFQLSKAAALAVRAAIARSSDSRVFVKWPNDIMIGSKKVCGILIENIIRGSQLAHAVVGIGVNVLQTTFAHPQATSLALNSSRIVQPEEVFDHILVELEQRYLQLKSKDQDVIDQEYLRHLYLRGQRHHFEVDGEHVLGTIVSVDEAGRLVVEMEGAQRSFDLKAIKYL